MALYPSLLYLVILITCQVEGIGLVQTLKHTHCGMGHCSIKVTDLLKLRYVVFYVYASIIGLRHAICPLCSYGYWKEGFCVHRTLSMEYVAKCLETKGINLAK